MPHEHAKNTKNMFDRSGSLRPHISTKKPTNPFLMSPKNKKNNERQNICIVRNKQITMAILDLQNWTGN